jgi:hypothetical protein
MHGESRATALATSLLHIGGFSGAGAHLANNDPYGAITISLVACLCVILLTATVILCEMVRLRVRAYVVSTRGRVRHRRPTRKTIRAPSQRDKRGHLERGGPLVVAEPVRGETALVLSN